MDAQDILGVRPSRAPTPVEKLSQSLNKMTPLTKGDKDVGGGLRGSQSLPSLAPSFPALKKRKVKRKAVPWVWRSFQSSARQDQIRLCHWVKASDDSSVDYPFARFNKKAALLTYTAEEYEKYLQSETWTKEETDHLFDLCGRFDLRFPVIADRFEGEKSLEDMKDRFYSVSKTLIAARGGVETGGGRETEVIGAEAEPADTAVGHDAAKMEEVKVAGKWPMKTNTLLISTSGISETAGSSQTVWLSEMEMFVYDKDRDVRRRTQLRSLLSRNADQMKEEEFLIGELKRIETQHHVNR